MEIREISQLSFKSQFQSNDPIPRIFRKMTKWSRLERENNTEKDLKSDDGDATRTEMEEAPQLEMKDP